MLAADARSAFAGSFDGLTGFSRVAVAVSGGSDSMALLLLAIEWQRSGNGPRELVALSVDHGLRPESATEVLQVAQWCASLGIAHHVLAWTGEKPDTGIQAKARLARYDLLATWCLANRYTALLTGHTADDQAETVLMRQKRTMSDRSLAAIWPENEWRGIKLLRPLLPIRREALRDMLRSAGQTWLDDPSNDNVSFERVRIRQGMAADEVEPLAAMADAARQRVLQLDSRMHDWLTRHAVVDDYAVVRMPRQLLALEPADVRLAVLAWGLSVTGVGEPMERAAAEAIAQWLALGRENRRTANGAVLSGRRHVIEFMREPGRIRERMTCVGETGRLIFDGRFEVVAPPGAQVGPMGVKPSLKRPKDVPGLAFSSLPLVKMADGRLICPVRSADPAISATLCERFRL